MMPVAPPPEHLHRPLLDPPELFCRPFSLAEILSATHNFDESLVIGQGGFGKVYKGVIDNGASIVAVKRLSHESKQGESQFRTEIEMLSKFRHSHIVSLIGYCYSSTEMILVYQYMVNGALADHLYKSGKYGSRSTLSWVQRLKICLGAARGLDYLHTGTSVIHRDMKSSNILLDKNFAAKVSDFGLSRICPIDQSCTDIKTNVKGTMGYVDPEYMLTFKLTRKSDVYSFGVVLFEVLCGRRAVDFSLDEEQWSLARWAQYCSEKGTLHRIIDPNLRWEILPESFTEFGRIANQCLCYQSKKRPTMTQVVGSLELALGLQLGRKDSSAFEMEIIGTSEADEFIENVGSTMVQKDAIKSRSRDEDNNVVPPSHVKPRDRKGLSEMLQPFMFSTNDASDPLKVVERVQRKSHRQVELLSPIPKPPADEPEKPKEAEIAKPEEKKEKPKVIIVVLKLHMHCEDCAQEIKKRIQRMQGVENADPDLKSSQVTVKGVFDPQKLVEYVYKRTGKQPVIVNQEPVKKEENGEGEKKVEEKDAKKGESKEKKKEGGEEGAKTEGGQAETTVLDVKKNEFYSYPQINPIYPPQMFSDENPNACSVM